MNDTKKRYYEKIYNNAPMIECACGCGTLIKSKDKYGRDKKFVNGHNNRKYENPNQYKIEYKKNHKEKIKNDKKKRHHMLKVKCINMLGCKCQKCGIEYNGKNAAIFEFHHRNPEEKEFQIGNQLLNKAWLTIEKELNKCDLLCSNCHNLEHSEEF